MADTDSEVKWGMKIFDQFAFGERLPEAEKKGMILEAIQLGKNRAKEIRGEFGKRSCRELFRQFGVEIQLESSKRGTNEDYVKFAEFYPKSKKIILNGSALKRLNRKLDSGLAEEIILCHELYHYFEMERWGRTGEQFIRTVKLFGWIPVKRRMIPAAEAAANSFSKEFLQLDFDPQIIEEYYFAE